MSRLRSWSIRRRVLVLSGVAAVLAVTAGLFGLIALVVPALLIWLAIRLMRHPDKTAANNRVTLGDGRAQGISP